MSDLLACICWFDIEIIEEPQPFHKIDIHHPSVT